MRKAIAIIAAAGFVLAAWLYVPGLAASMTDTSKTEGAGNSAISKCDADGFTTLLNSTSGNVTTISVSGIASACGGSTLNARVANGVTSQSGSVAIPAGGGSVTVTLGTSIALTDSMSTDYFI